ncbi:MAG: TetR/AcrR family transcriptional regulator [bacterium]
MKDKREKILKAALGVICEVGLQSASVSQIVKRADVGMGTLYNYFSSKEELVSELYEELMKNLATATYKNIDPNLDAKNKFNKIFASFIEYSLNHQLEFQFIENYAHSPYISKKSLDIKEELMKFFDEFFIEIKKSFEVKDTKSSFYLKFVYGALSGVIKGHLLGYYTLTEKDINIALKSCWDAILK